MPIDVPDSLDSIRLDKWLFFARFFKTRTLAAKNIRDRRVRVDGMVQTKPSAMVGPGAVLTFQAGNRIRVARIIECGTRRGPAPEAQALYEDLSPPPPERQAASPRAQARPDKKARREIMRLKQGGEDGLT